MRITVHYMAQLRQAAGAAQEVVEVEGDCTLVALLLRLAGSRGESFHGMLVDGQGKLQPSLLLFVEEEQVRGERLLRDGDSVTLLTPMAGG